jgi:hypothetical protein
MKSRNRFVKNGAKFFIDQLTPLVESLSDAEEVFKTADLLDQFEIFINEVAYSSTTARRLGVFANQWNLKQRGIYDGISRFSSYVSSKLVNKIRDLQSIGDDDILKKHVDNLASKDSLAFLSMSFPASGR